MDFYTFILAWITAVLAMTGFSALLSKILHLELREHILLFELMDRLKKNETKRRHSVLKGWVVHLAMGLFFMAIYEILWAVTNVERTFFWGVIFGMLLGLFGISGWVAMFKLHPQPPKINFLVYYSQLLLAHIVFSLAALLVYKLFQP